MTAPKEADDFGGEIYKLASRNRLTIPAPLRRRLDWYRAQAPLAIIAELWEPGVVFLFPSAALAPQLAARRAEIKKSGKTEDERLRELTAFNDRYREVNMSIIDGKDGRVTLTESIVSFLGHDLAVGDRLYVRGFKNGVEVTTLARRDDTLDEFADHAGMEPDPDWVPDEEPDG